MLEVMSTIKRRVRSARRKLGEARLVAASLQSPYKPILAQIVPVRRCNLSCTYCSEYDDFSKPVPTPVMLRRIDLLAALRTAAITLSGGEPLLHPDAVAIIRRIRKRGARAGLLTNGYLLTAERIKELNRAGLDYLQISVDNVNPDEVSKKSLRVLDKKLQWLAEYAEFDVTINSVLGSAIQNPEDALAVNRRSEELGLKSGVGIIHDASGQLRPLNEAQNKIYETITRRGRTKFSEVFNYDRFQENLARGLPNQWQCRAGSRFLYICEDGLVHYCSQQRGHPGIPLERYSTDDLEREYRTEKTCAPYCTVTCVHRVSVIDEFRENPREAVDRFFPGRHPAPVRVLEWLFMPGRGKGQRVLTKAALRCLGIGR